MVSEEVFELLAFLGSGYFARTHKARVLDRDLIEEYGTDTVALKEPHDRKKAKVLRAEVEMNAVLHLRLKQLQAPNLVRYLGFDTFRNQTVMIMEYVAGGSLRDRIGGLGAQKPLPIGEAVRIAKGVLEGLVVIHGEQVFHRDIKPENILMVGETPKISDLGISRMLRSDELASTTSGTLPYMSPEILGIEGASFTSDIWSLGVTFYEMLAGRLPFGGKGTPFKEMVNLICGPYEPTPVTQLRPDIPPALADIIARTLRKDSRERFQTARDAREAIERFESGANDEIEVEMRAVQEMLSDLQNVGLAEGRLLALVEKHPEHPRVYQQLGEFYNRCMRHEDAVRAFKQGLHFDPASATLHWDLALACQMMGRKREAAANLEKAMSLGLDASLRRRAEILLKALRRR